MKQQLLKHLWLVGISWVWKSTFANEFQGVEHGYLSLSSFVRQQTEIRLLELNRENFRQVAADLRKTLWNWFLAKFAYEYMQSNQWKKFIIDGIRHTDEITFLSNNLDITFIWIGVDDTEELIKRIFERKKHTDVLTREGILSAIQNEKESTSMNVTKCLELCNILIDNWWSIDLYKSKIEQIKPTLIF